MPMKKKIIDAVQLAKSNGIKKMVIVGGYEAYKTAELLQNNIGVLLKEYMKCQNMQMTMLIYRTKWLNY
jgi:6-phosphofructokinase